MNEIVTSTRLNKIYGTNIFYVFRFLQFKFFLIQIDDELDHSSNDPLAEKTMRENHC